MTNVETVFTTTDADHQMLCTIFRLLAERGRKIREAKHAPSETEEIGTTNSLVELSHEQRKKKLDL